jgi:deoxyribodipyrimidine photolyase-related protein
MTTDHAGFVHALRRAASGPDRRRRWVYVHEDQLTDRVGPLARTDPRDAGIVLVESRWKAALRPWHRQRLALLWANQRHFALEQARRGVRVEYVVTRAPLRATLPQVLRRIGPDAPVQVMRPAEREARADLAPLLRDGTLAQVPHEGWLTTPEDFRASHRAPPWRMDVFYRHVRRSTGILMTRDGRFVGGRVSFDTENRRPWRGDPPPASPPTFTPDAITAEVVALIESRYAHHPGRLDPQALPATLDDAERLWAWARRACLPWFGPYEDAMSLRSRTLFHTRVSSLMNLLRLLPRRLVAEAEALEIPLASKEGFIRQILGWREFVRHVHEATDGFRTLPAAPADPPTDPPTGPPVEPPVDPAPGDAGYAAWSGHPWTPIVHGSFTPDGGAAPRHLGGQTPLPPAWWGAESGLRCLDHVVRSVWEEGWSHHITRLMVLSNLATLLDVSPRQLTDWFWVAYTDAWDWVVEPNVLAMGTYAVGGLMTTKPYVAGAAYIDRMSDFCGDCRFRPGSTCPVTPLYWAFLERHRATLATNPRLFMPMNALSKRTEAQRRHDREVFLHVRDVLVAGRPLEPAAMPPPPPATTTRRARRRA